MITPFIYQSECRTALDSARSQGERRALVVMASGLGKTVTSALDVRSFMAERGKGRLLYLCHQNDILDQSRGTFEEILGTDYSFGCYNGFERKIHQIDCVFASFQSLRSDIRSIFRPDEFDYIVVDESHHTHAQSYLRVVQYFQPKFLLGMTATPDREDGLNIRSVYGDEVYYLPLEEALIRGLLTPVDYRLLSDEIALERLSNVSEDDLSLGDVNKLLFTRKGDEEVMKVIERHAQGVVDPRIIVFTGTTEHADQFARVAPNALAIHSKIPKNQRPVRLELFRSGFASTAVAVDCFNEGIDVPEANIIVFLRSTTSSRIFFQQLGRGLRRCKGKEKVVVLDFVGNCERISMLKDLSDTLDVRVKQARPEQLIGSGKTDYSLPSHTLINPLGITLDEKTLKVLEVIKQVRTKRIADVPELLAEFSSKNMLTASHLSARAHKQVWWKCGKCDYEWMASPSRRLSGKGCPECAMRVTEDNNLLKYPHLVRQFSARNELRPVQVHRDSKDLFWWDCRVCGFEYQATVIGRTRRRDSCPQCAAVLPQLKSNLAFNHPKLAAEYSHLNVSSPETIDAKSIRPRHWICSDCGHTWQASARARVNGQKGCPICTAKIATTESNIVVSHPHLADEYSSRNRKPIETILASTDEKLWWVCSDCGRYWEASGRERLNGVRCPYCVAENKVPV